MRSGGSSGPRRRSRGGKSVKKESFCEVHSFDEYLDVIQYLAQEKPSHLADRMWFRGESRWYGEPVPSVHRAGNAPFEQHLANSFLIEARQAVPHLPERENYAAWITLMQHYGVPTRVLDWSASPLVALYFATKKSLPSESAYIWVLFPRMLNEAEGLHGKIYPMSAKTVQERLAPAFTDRVQAKPSILACRSVEYDGRVHMQQSAFTVHTSPAYRLHNVAGAEEMLYLLKVPADCRAHFARGLETFGFTECYFFPDLEHIARKVEEQCRRRR